MSHVTCLNNTHEWSYKLSPSGLGKIAPNQFGANLCPQLKKRKKVALWLETMIKHNRMKMMKEVNIYERFLLVVDELVVSGVVKGKLGTHLRAWAW